MTMDVARLVELTTQSKPKAATHWSTRTMAAEPGVSAASVSRHWRANGLKPHIVRVLDGQVIGQCQQHHTDVESRCAPGERNQSCVAGSDSLPYAFLSP